MASSGQIFLDEPGKTKTSPLVRLADSKTILNLEPGQKVKLLPKRRFITIFTEDDECIGSLPDDLSSHLSSLIKAGNKYEALIRRVEKNTVYVFIKETKRTKRFANTPSFSGHTPSKIPQINPSATITETPIDVTPTGEEEAYK